MENFEKSQKQKNKKHYIVPCYLWLAKGAPCGQDITPLVQNLYSERQLSIQTIVGKKVFFPVIFCTPWSSQIACLRRLNLFGFSPMCIFKCVFNLILWGDAKSHWSVITSVFTFLHCVFSNVPSNWMDEKMHNYIDCICLFFLLLCVFTCLFKLLAW